MSNEIIIPQHYEIITSSGTIEFVGYEDIKASVTNLAEHVQNMEVTDENVKESKKLLAEVNKAMGSINKARIEAKNELLAPYVTIENQVKEIEEILKIPTSVVRSQISELDEKERDAKFEKLKEIFLKRSKSYKFPEFINFDSFVTNQHLNKSTSIKKVEEEMVTFLESTKSDIAVINSMDNSESILEEYTSSLNLAQAITTVKTRLEREETIRAHKAEIDAKKKVKPEPVERVVSFIVTGDKDIQLAQMILEKADISFTTEEF